jgi:hypothetical protein
MQPMQQVARAALLQLDRAGCGTAGMAGSGKTTFLQRINSYLHTKNIPAYIINLDPAVTQVPYGANIDIRDTVWNRAELAPLVIRHC